jgi:prolyl oligopeptidase
MTRSTNCAPAVIRIDAPTDATVSMHRDWLLIELRTDWYTGSAEYVAGSLLAADYDEFLAGTAQLQIVFEPDAHTSLNHYAWTREKLVVVTLVDVASRVEVVTPGSWQAERVPGIPENTNTVIVNVDEFGDEMFLDSSGFDTPSRLLYGTAGCELEEIEAGSSFFDAADLEVTQQFATSDDGTAIPYFVVSHRHLEAPGPTLLGGYGGFEVARTPGYDGVLGRLWLARGGTMDGQHPWRRRVRAGMAYPGDARRKTPRRRGLRRCGKGSGSPRDHDRRTLGRRAEATAAC